MANKITRAFESAREDYLAALALRETVSEMMMAYYREYGISEEMLVEMEETNTLPEELVQLDRDFADAVEIHRDAFIALLDTAEAMTAQLAKRHRRAAAELTPVFEHLRRNPYSPTSRKALDLILRVNAR